MEPKKKGGLGKGLSAILSADVRDAQINEPLTPANNINLIRVNNIETNPFQPRTEFEETALQELADSIKVHGIIQPITVRKLSDGVYQLISGERRLRASRIAGLEEVPAYIRTANDEQMIEMALIENIQRQDLNPVEIALTYKRMMEELGLKQEELGEKVGKNRSSIANFVRLLKLPPEIQIGLRDGRISMGHAKPLITMDNPDLQLSLYHQIIDSELNVRQAEQKAKELLLPKTPKPLNEKKDEVQDKNKIYFKDLEDKLEYIFGNRVIISQTDKGRGEVRIEFQSTDDLNRLLELWNAI
ncbi:MAG: ParB/RepB/Spo0J family partition protein [Bacteroidia bacterium]|nr:ParB/RepB/Spo0J family partition protein [Bacteroidia bacterium]